MLGRGQYVRAIGTALVNGAEVNPLCERSSLFSRQHAMVSAIPATACRQIRLTPTMRSYRGRRKGRQYQQKELQDG